MSSVPSRPVLDATVQHAAREAIPPKTAPPPPPLPFGSAWLSAHGVSPPAPKKARVAWPEVLVVVSKDAPRRSFLERRIQQAGLGGEMLTPEQLRIAEELGITVPMRGKRVSWGVNPPVAEVLHEHVESRSALPLQFPSYSLEEPEEVSSPPRSSQPRVRPPSPGPEGATRPSAPSAARRRRVAVIFSGPQDNALVKLLHTVFDVDSYDVLVDPIGQDVLRSEVLNPLMHRVTAGEYAFVWVATPCCSYSILQGRRPLHDPLCSEGWGDLSPFQKAYLRLHNRLAEITKALCWAAHRSSTPWACENPSPRHDKSSPAYWQDFEMYASLFDMPCMKLLIENTGATLSIFAQCEFGAEFQKYTAILAAPRLSKICARIFGHRLCTHSSHEHLAMGTDEAGRSLAARSAAYSMGLCKAVLRLIVESVQASTMSYGDTIHLGSASPHEAGGQHAAAEPETFTPTGSMRQLEPELDSVLLDEPMPLCNEVPKTDKEDPPSIVRPVPGPFTTKELIPDKIYKDTIEYRDKVLHMLKRARGKGSSAWQAARSLRPEAITWSEHEAINECGWGYTWRYNLEAKLWYAVEPSRLPEKPPDSSIDVEKFIEFVDKYELTDKQLVSWLEHGFPGATKLPSSAQLAPPHIGALKHAVELQACNQKDIDSKFVSSGFEFPEFWPSLIDAVNIVVQNGNPRLCIDKTMLFSKVSYNSTIDLEADEAGRRVKLVRVWQLFRGAAILDAACRHYSILSKVMFAKFDLKAFFRQHGKQTLHVWQSGRLFETLFGSDFRVNFGERDAPDHTGRASNALCHFIKREFARLDAVYKTRDEGLLKYLAHRLGLADAHGDKDDKDGIWVVMFFLCFYVDDAGMAIINDLLFDANGGVFELVVAADGTSTRMQCTRAPMYFDAGLKIANYIGYGTPLDKRWYPWRSMVFLGVLGDLDERSRRLDDVKRKRYLLQLQEVRKGRAVISVSHLTITDTDPCNSLYHKLIHASDTRPLGRPQLYHLGKALRAPNRLSPGGVILSAAAVRELDWWEAELLVEKADGIPLASRSSFPAASSPLVLVAYSDASREIDEEHPELRGGDNGESGLGAWAVIDYIFYYVEDRWEASELRRFSINVLEFAAECIGIFTLVDFAATIGVNFEHVLSFVDNTSAEFVSERGRPGTDGMHHINQHRLSELHKRQLHQKTSRVPSKTNLIADLLSRGSIAEALRFARSAGLPVVKLPCVERWRNLSDIPPTWDE